MRRLFKRGARVHSRLLAWRHDLTVFLHGCAACSAVDRGEKIDQSLSIVAETEQITDRRNSLLKSRARIFDGSVSQFFAVWRKDLC